MAVSGSMMNPSIAQEPVAVNSTQMVVAASQSTSPITTKFEARTAAASTGSNAENQSSSQQNKKNASNTNAGVEMAVREYFADIPLMVEIARCESKFRQFGTDGNALQGKMVKEDTGVLQVNKTYHLKRANKLGYDLDTLAGNMAYSRLLHSEQGYWPWISSNPCWGKSPLAANFNAQMQARQAAKVQAQLAKANPDATLQPTAAAVVAGTAVNAVVTSVTSASPASTVSAASAPVTVPTANSASVSGALNAVTAAMPSNSSVIAER